MTTLKAQITDDMKTAMKAKDKPRLSTIRLLQAAIKQREVDERIELDDTQIIIVLDKMVKQRKDSIEQYEKAGRQELADQEQFEIDILKTYLPQQLSAAEIEQLIGDAIAQTGASGMRDMGKVMGLLKPQLQGRADMGAVSGLIKQKLS
ncbi:GatB/YqeY domain-containing protein [Candidatus Venteria ishoeyi]|uniref:Yqey-like protein n=1 Tax=Candidatus Venteria ishoeyi TaxID=1899563 RepID=A0A1H6FF48_9GAMM|nr:GatB/YqeY domain-containing protein [Candidatus Venteria ishoeyi]MDM8546878.1 GatB/YqeY domain-containing protein [Candidatus Venteria ishoeyi]SEH08692.1 Yqey-like protein [Candidatus Venteria ishoeyi]